MDCDKCEHGNATSGGARVCGLLLHGGETVFIHNGKIRGGCPITGRMLAVVREADQMTDLPNSDLIKMVRTLELDHDPEGFPAIKMKDVSALAQMVEGAKRIRFHPNRMTWNPDGFWLDEEFVGDMETAFYKAGAAEAAPRQRSKPGGG